MFDLRFVNKENNELRLGHLKSDYVIKSLSGADGVEVDLATSQGFEQIGESLDAMSVGKRQIGITGRIDNFKPSQLRALDFMFAPRTQLRMFFEDKYWIDAAVKSAPVYSYEGCTVRFAISLLAPYPYWKSVASSYYKLNGLIGGFNFPVSYDRPHNFALFNDSLFINCVNRGNTEVDYIAEIRCLSGSVTNVRLTNAENQKFIRVKTTITAEDTVRIFRENNILRVTKTTGGIESDIFSLLDEDSDLDYMDIGDNVIRADKEGGDGVPVVTVKFYDTVTGVYYGI